MSFDALTIGGLLLALASGALVVGVVVYNGRPTGSNTAE
jgi:hypothetical protein